MAETNRVEPVISVLSGESGNEVTEIESFCFNCHKNGKTKLLLTRIPFFREVVISSFECENCGTTNNTVDPATPCQDQGKLFTLSVRCPKDLNRRIIQPSHSEIIIPSLDSSFPNSEACLTTIEGIISKIIENISILQPERQKSNPEQAALLEDFLGKLRDLLEVKVPFTLKLDDPSGNGFIENFRVPLSDPQLSCTKYLRTAAQNELLGLNASNNLPDEEEEPSSLKDSVSTFHVECPNCHSNCETNMKMVDIPNFKEVILMAINCEFCGYRDNEVRAVSSIAEKGRQYVLRLEKEEDLSRDVLISDTTSLKIPDIELEAETGTLGGRLTTVEGLLVAIKDQLKSLNPMLFGDSAHSEDRQKGIFSTCQKLDQIITGELKVRLELRDPAGNNYIQSLVRSESDKDERLEITDFERIYEENEELGLNDMKTENVA